MWFFPLDKKYDALPTFISFKLHVEKLLGLAIKQLQIDAASEYKRFRNFIASHGITHNFSCPHTHSQNGLDERKHWYLVETGLTLLGQCLHSINMLVQCILLLSLILLTHVHARFAQCLTSWKPF